MMAARLSERLGFQVAFWEDSSGVKIKRWPTTVDFYAWGEVQRQSETQSIFIIRYRSGITPELHRVIFDAAYWNVNDVVHDRRRIWCRITSDLSEKIDVTHFQSTKREFIDGLPAVHP